MKNRVVRWIIYIVIGVAIGVGVSYYQKQKKMDAGVVELSPDEVQEEGLEIPSRDEAEGAVEGAIDRFVEDAEDAGNTLEKAGESLMDKTRELGEDLMGEDRADEGESAMPAEDEMTIEETVEDVQGTVDQAAENAADTAGEAAQAVEEKAGDVVDGAQNAAEDVKENVEAAAPGTPDAPADDQKDAPALTPMPE